MKYHYKATYTDPGSADLVYAKLKQQFPSMEIHISESDYPQKPHRISHAFDHTDTEFGTEVSFAILAPLTANHLSPAELVTQNTTGVTPSPYGSIEPFLSSRKPAYLHVSSAVIYGSCDSAEKPTVIQNLRRYGADSVMTSIHNF